MYSFFNASDSNSTSRQSLFKFCNNTCQILSVFSVDASQSTLGVSKINNQYFTLPTDTCSASYLPKEDWNKLVETPFIPLYEPYQECTKSKATAVIDSMGIGMGNVTLFSLLLFIILLLCVCV